MLRGRLIRTVRPVSASTLAIVIESGRRPDAPGAGVPAEQQHVVAAVVRRGRRALAERRDHEVAVHADEVGAEQQAAGDRQAEEAVDADHGPAVLLAERERLADPPGVHEENGPADGQPHQQEPEQAEGQRVHGHPEREPVPDQAEAEDEEGADHQDHPDPHRDPTDLPVARHQLGGPGEDQRHQHQRDGAAEADPRSAVTGGAADAAARSRRATRGTVRAAQETWGRCLSLLGKEAGRAQVSPVTPVTDGSDAPYAAGGCRPSSARVPSARPARPTSGSRARTRARTRTAPAPARSSRGIA